VPGTPTTLRPVRKPHQSRAIRTREALVAAGAQEFSSRGYASATSKSIAKAAGVATGTFYQYFTDKDALLREIASSRLMSVGARALTGLADGSSVGLEALRPLVRQQLVGLVQIVTAYHRDDPGLHAVLTERRHADPELDAITSAAELDLVFRIEDLLRRWGRDGDHRATAFVLFGMVEGSVHAHVLGTSVVDDERFTLALVDAVIRVALPDR
jgi:AcrR family transcriptional regulator